MPRIVQERVYCICVQIVLLVLGARSTGTAKRVAGFTGSD